MPREPRMDGALVLDDDGALWVRERPPRAQGRAGRGRQAPRTAAKGILVHAQAFLGDDGEGEFKFMTSEVSREKPIDYALMAQLLIDERERGGYPIWVTGPALVHSRARADMSVVHRERLRRRAARRQRGRGARHRGVDLRHDARHDAHGRGDAGRSRTAHARDQPGARRGLDRKGRGAGNHHGRNHVRVRRAQGAVRAHRLDSRRWSAARRHHRHRSPAQDAMKAHTIKATMAILIATALHAIATGNMLPAFVTEPDGTMRELPTICVDSSEFVVSKLKDRGTHQAFGVVTNAQDFMHILTLYVERELDARSAAMRRDSGATARAR